MDCKGGIGFPFSGLHYSKGFGSVHMSWMLMFSYQGCLMHEHPWTHAINIKIFASHMFFLLIS
jgi:hypothetical protein